MEPNHPVHNDGTLFAVLTILLIMALLNVIIGGLLFQWGAGAAFLILSVLGLRTFSIREVSLLVICVLISAAIWILTGQTGPLISALDLAAFFGAFIAALTIMRDVAARSRSVLAVGRYLIHQPPGRRYYATSVGGHFLGIFLNFGAVSLMSPLIQESVKDRHGEADVQLERRQLSALIRGFAWVILWAPTTLSQAILLTIFTEVTWSDLAPVAMGTAVLFIVLGRLYDRYEWRGTTSIAAGAPPDIPWRAAVVVAGVCTLLIGTTVLGSTFSGTSIAVALMWVAPLVTIAWFIAQNRPVSVRKVPEILFNLGALLRPSAPALTRAAVALGLSGFIGRSLGQAIPTEIIAATIDLSSIPGWLFLATLPVLITLGGQIALSPILLVVLLGEILRGVDTLPTGQLQILFALTIGWSLSMTSSPNSTATLLVSATTGIAPTTLTWKWNLRYGLLCYGAAVCIFAIIA